jgi:hypothetical protein
LLPTLGVVLREEKLAIALDVAVQVAIQSKP